MHLKLSRKIILRKFLFSRKFLWILTLALKSPFLGFWILASYILLRYIWSLANRRIISSTSFSISYCSGYEARRVQHFPDFNLESIFTIYLLWKIQPISVKGWRPVLGESPTTSHCQVECWHVWLWKSNFFYYKLFKLSYVKVEKLENYCLRLKWQQ